MKTVAFNCPACQSKQKAEHDPGAVAICNTCAAILIIQVDGAIVASEEDLKGIQANEADWSIVQLARHHILTYWGAQDENPF